MQALPPSERFLEALSSNSSVSHIALPESISHFYSEALDLCTSFDNDDNSASFPHPYAGLISVFDEHVTAAVADLAKPQPKEDNSESLIHLDPDKRHEEGECSFVQDEIVGFRRNWGVFSQDSLGGLNWYIFFLQLSNMYRANVLAAGGSVSACLQPLPHSCLWVGKHPAVLPVPPFLCLRYRPLPLWVARQV